MEEKVDPFESRTRLLQSWGNSAEIPFRRPQALVQQGFTGRYGDRVKPGLGAADRGVNTGDELIGTTGLFSHWE